MKVLFVFIDGLGLREPAEDNPVNQEICPVLCKLIANHAISIDACLDVPGLPQSATGQTTIYTGRNASQYMGRHCEGFPGPSLRKIITENNIFMELKRKGLRCRFADGYAIDHYEDLYARRFKSVTTVMALTQPETISIQDDLLNNQAVSHDITRQFLRERGYDLPIVKPAQAAEHLFQVAKSHDFTLFEYFLSDMAGHSRDIKQASKVLATIDIFLDVLFKLCQAAGMLLIITSDHGNIEDLSVRGHTRNPVPFIAIGPGSEVLKAHIKSLVDITPAIMRIL